MSFQARVFRILIASPSDVADERDIAVRTIQEWNDLNSAERQIVLLPLRWETHTAPQYGERPQEVVNRQVVDHCDFLIGIFWTRIGSPTGQADSGTLEEIERVASSGRPVMLYFSQAKADPEKLDLEQLKLLRAFKKETLPEALVETYTTDIDFRDKLWKQLEIQIRTIIAKADKDANGETLPVTDIRFHLADPATGTDAGDSLELESTVIYVEDFDQIADYEKEHVVKEPLGSGDIGLIRPVSIPHNKDYYRQVVTYFMQRSFLRPIRFWLKNVGGVGARDVYLDLSVKAEGGEIVVLPALQMPSVYPSRELAFGFGLPMGAPHASGPTEVFQAASHSWRTHLELRALQPQRELSPEPHFLIGALEDSTVTVDARIFADTLAKPMTSSVEIVFKSKLVEIASDALLAEIES